MAMKNISDVQVLEAYLLSESLAYYCKPREWPDEILHRQTGECLKVCHRVCERASYRGYLDYGISLRSGWVTQKGFDMLKEMDNVDRRTKLSVCERPMGEE